MQFIGFSIFQTNRVEFRVSCPVTIPVTRCHEVMTEECWPRLFSWQCPVSSARVRSRGECLQFFSSSDVMLRTPEPPVVTHICISQSEASISSIDQSEAPSRSRADVASRTFLCKLPAIAGLMPGNLGLTLLTRGPGGEETRHFERSGLWRI